MKYYYKGVTKSRDQVNGLIDATDELEAELKLRGMQIRVVSLSPNKGPAMLSLNLKSLNEIYITSPVDLKSMQVFTRQFSSLIDSGIAVVQCLDILSDQEKNKVFKTILKTVKSDVETGSSLSDALGKHPKIFGQFFIRIVEAGEMSGTLDIALRRIGEQLEKLGRIRAKVIGALTYPSVTLVIAIGVMLFLLMKVVPEVTKLYSQSKASLPGLTVQVIALSDWVRVNYSLIFWGGGLSILLFGFLYRRPEFRKVFDQVILKVPIVGPLILKSEVARFARTMSTLVGAGVPLLNGFEICEKLVSNTCVKSAISRAAQFVSEGKGIAAGLAENKVFPTMVLHMVSVGEMTGRMEELLGRVADIYDDEVDDAVGNMTGLLQPILIVVVGLMIAFMMAAMYLPIFQLADKIGG